MTMDEKMGGEAKRIFRAYPRGKKLCRIYLCLDIKFLNVGETLSKFYGFMYNLHK